MVGSSEGLLACWPVGWFGWLIGCSVGLFVSCLVCWFVLECGSDGWLVSRLEGLLVDLWIDELIGSFFQVAAQHRVRLPQDLKIYQPHTVGRWN